MKTSAEGRALIEAREGRRLIAYHDTQGILTIGVGHTGRMSPPPVRTGMTITAAQCDAMLANDLGPVEAAIDTAVTVPLTQNEFDALSSLGFNIGTVGLKRSTVIRRLNLGDIAGAAEAFLMWDRPAVLVARRKAEAAQFLTPEVGGGQGVMAARAATLATNAETATAKAHGAQSGAAALVAASATLVATTHADHPALAFVFGALVLAAALCVAGVAVIHNRAAQTLATNAARHALAADAGPFVTASTDLVTAHQR